MNPPDGLPTLIRIAAAEPLDGPDAMGTVSCSQAILPVPPVPKTGGRGLG